MNFEPYGYKLWDTRLNTFGITKYFQRRVDTDDDKYRLPLCQCNDKLFINIEHYDFKFQDCHQTSCSISLSHENADNNWCDIKIYSLDPIDLQENLEKYEGKILAMWDTFNK